MSSCIACCISKRITPSCIIYETAQLICFLDHDPINVGHVLICPKEHYVNITDLPDPLISESFILAKKIAKHLELSLRCDGVSLLQNNGIFNDLGHFHLHVFPRFLNDGFSWVASSEKIKSMEELRNSMGIFLNFDKTHN